MIELKDVSKYYHTNDIISMGIRNVNLSFNVGEIVAITGESGSGKSTLLNVITKIDTFDDGEIYYKGNETSYFSISDMDDFRKNKIGFIFQNSNIIDSYTVLENVMLPLTLKGMDNKSAKKRALDLIKKVGLTHRLRSRGTKLSGGEKQRCVIARALASDCEILACDEPTGNLDSKTGKEIIDLIKEVAKDKLVLIVTHNYDQVKDIVTRKITVEDGQIVEDTIIKKVEDNLNEELDLDYKPLKKKICARVARNNVIFTPKKTFFVALLFLAVCFGSLFMFQYIYSSYGTIDSTQMYSNVMPNRTYIYNSDHSIIDDTILKGYDYDKNPIYEEYSAETRISETRYHLSAYYSDRLEYNILIGNNPEEENEVLLIYSNTAYEYGFADVTLLDKTVIIRNSYFKISGIAISDYFTDKFDGVFSQNTAVRDRIQADIYLQYIRAFAKESEINSNEIEFATHYVEEKTDFTLHLPKDLKGKPLEIQFRGGIFNLNTCFEIVYEDPTNDSSTPGVVVEDGPSAPYLEYGYESFNNLPIFEAAVYGNTSKIKSNLQKGILQVDICKDITDQNIVDMIIRNLYAFLTIFLSSFVLIIVFFLTYVILSKVYSSRKKDYEILRTLGVTKKDMRYIVNFEIATVGIICSIVNYLVFFLLIKYSQTFSILGNLNVYVSIYYFVLMFLFVFSLSNRFNKKLFKFSVTKSLKGGDIHA